jgi:hypothetical protein
MAPLQLTQEMSACRPIRLILGYAFNGDIAEGGKSADRIADQNLPAFLSPATCIS